MLTTEQRELIERRRQAALQRLEEWARRREAMQAAATPGNAGSGGDVESGSEASDVESEESDSGGSEGSDSGSEFMFDKASSTKKRTKVLPATAAPASIEVFGEESDSGSDLTPLEGYASGSDSGSDFADFTPRGQRRCCAKTSVPAASSSENAKGPPSKTPADTPATPVSVEVFGERGVLQAKRGPAPPTVEAFGEHGVLQAEPGPPSAAELVRRFIETHDDARVLPNGKVLCTTTGHEMPAKINDVLGHWGGRRYRQACGGARRVRRSPGGGSPAIAAAGTTTREAACSGGKVVKRTKKSRPPTSPQVGGALDPATIQPTHHTHTPHLHHAPRTTHHAPRTTTNHSPRWPAGAYSLRWRQHGQDLRQEEDAQP